MLAGPVPRVRGPALTAAAPASHTTLSRPTREVAVVRVPALLQSSPPYQTVRGSSSAPRRKPLDSSASACEHKDGQNQHADRVSHSSRQERASGALGSCAVRAGWEVVCCMFAHTSIAPQKKQPTARVEAGEEVESRTSHGASQPLCTLSTCAAQRDRDEGDGSQCPMKCEAVFLRTKAERHRLRV